MKKIIISLVFLAPFLTGCANVDNRLTINDDRSAAFVSSVTYKGDLSSTSDKNAQKITQNYDKFLDDGYGVDKTTSANLSTITASKAVKDLSARDIDLSSLGFESNLDSKKFVEIKKNFVVTSYNIDMTFNAGKQAAKIEEPIVAANKSTVIPEYFHKYANLEDIESTNGDNDFLDNLDEATREFMKKDLAQKSVTKDDNEEEDLNMSFSIKVPAFASYNNADSVDGTVYSWEIDEDSPTVIKLQYVQYSGYATTFVILLGILLFAILAIKIARHESNKRIDNIDNIV